jgi:hypothetical protein
VAESKNVWPRVVQVGQLAGGGNVAQFIVTVGSDPMYPWNRIGAQGTA